MIKYGKNFLHLLLSRQFNSEESFIDLKKREEHESSVDDFHNRLFYLSTAPEFFPTVLNHLKSIKLNQALENGWSRVIVEKPFGTDLSTAQI